jgi:hypothetical protein
VVTSLEEVLSLEVTHGRRIYRGPGSTEATLGEKLIRAQSGVRIGRLRGRVTSLNRLNGLCITTRAGSRLTVRTRIRKRALNTEGTLYLLESLTHGTLGAGIVT